MATIIFEEQLEIPSIENLADFRRWALSEEFPKSGRIDFIAGRVEVDMSPEDLFTHGTLKSNVTGRIEQRVAAIDLGLVVSDSSRVSCPVANFSAEPDVVVITYEAIDSGQVTLVPKSSSKEGRYVEIEGAPDLIVEIVSDSSVVKDTKRLPVAYFQAGVREYWLIDARGEELLFQIQRRSADRFEPTPCDDEGMQTSEVLGKRCRLHRERHQRGHWVYDLVLE